LAEVFLAEVFFAALVPAEDFLAAVFFALAVVPVSSLATAVSLVFDPVRRPGTPILP
jgi:hypothetical protein